MSYIKLSIFDDLYQKWSSNLESLAQWGEVIMQSDLSECIPHKTFYGFHQQHTLAIALGAP